MTTRVVTEEEAVGPHRGNELKRVIGPKLRDGRWPRRLRPGGHVRLAGGEGRVLGITAGTTLAFFAMVGFEDSVNMAEETRDPVRIFPKIMLSGITITGIIYILVSISAVALVPPGELGATPLVKVVQAGFPAVPVSDIIPVISMFAVFTMVNISVLVLRRDKVEHRHFKAPAGLPIIAALFTAYLVGPWTGRNPQQYVIAGVLLLIGIGLWLITWFINRAIYARKTYVKDPTALE